MIHVSSFVIQAKVVMAPVNKPAPRQRHRRSASMSWHEDECRFGTLLLPVLRNIIVSITS